MEILFKPKKIEEKSALGTCFSDKEIMNISGDISKLSLSETYVLFGDKFGDIFKFSSCYPYRCFIGEIIDSKYISSTKNKVTVLLDTGIKKTFDANSLFIEENSKHFFRGYEDNKKFVCTYSSKIITAKFKIKTTPNRFDSTDYAHCKIELLDKQYSSDKETVNKRIFYRMKGNITNLYKNDEACFTGYFDEDKYGIFFKLINYSIESSSGIIMLKSYLKNIFKGTFSASSIKKIVDKFGNDTLTIMEKEPEKVVELFKKSKKITEEIIKTKLMSAKFLQDFFFFCETQGISNKTAQLIFNEYGLSSVKVLKDNPYVIVKNKKEMFLDADLIAFKYKFDYKNENRIKCAIMCFLNSDVEHFGNTYTNMDDFLNNFNDYFVEIGCFKEKLRLTDKEQKDYLYLLNAENLIKIDDNRIYLIFNYIYEKKSADFIKTIVTDTSFPFCMPNVVNEAILDYEKHFAQNLASEQKDAVKNALTKQISILTGGPGTGKTLTVKAIISCIKYVKNNAVIKLCAPTGRASKRMTEVSNEGAETIHKLLKINGFDKKDDLEELDEYIDYIIIDEFSMVDIELFYKLLKKIPQETRIVIVGDYNQLPSVGPGQVLKDLIDSEIIATTKLTKIFRQAESSNIVKVSHAIANKKDINFNDFVCDINDVCNKDFSILNTTDTTEGLNNIILVTDMFLNKGFSLQDIQVLAPLNVSSIGCNKINETMQKYYNGSLREEEKYYLSDFSYLGKGDKIIQTKNDYDIGVMNGSLGEIMDVRKIEDVEISGMNEDELIVSINGDTEDSEFKGISIFNLKLAYAISIHKSQGSECPVVIIPLSESQIKTLNRNLLYTGITRSKEYIVLISSTSLLSKILKIDGNTRNSYLKERLQKNAESQLL